MHACHASVRSVVVAPASQLIPCRRLRAWLSLYSPLLFVPYGRIPSKWRETSEIKMPSQKEDFTAQSSTPFRIASMVQKKQNPRLVQFKLECAMNCLSLVNVNCIRAVEQASKHFFPPLAKKKHNDRSILKQKPPSPENGRRWFTN